MLFCKNRKDIMKIDEAKQTKREQLRELAQKLKSLTEEQKTELVKGVCVTNIEGRELSAANQMLVIMQNKLATIVGGFRQWQAQGRRIKKGSVGSVIFIPIGKKNDKGEIDGEEGVHFICGNVFDITQTEEIK